SESIDIGQCIREDGSIDHRQCIAGVTMSRVQLALNVSNLEAAIGFYSQLFATEPAKVRPGYANFAIAEPPLKLVLIEGHGEAGATCCASGPESAARCCG